MDERNSARQDVCIGVPVAPGYPAAPPPPTVAPPNPPSTEPNDCISYLLVDIFITAAIIMALYVFHTNTEDAPSFKLDAVSVSLDHNDSSSKLVIAKWNIGFSVENSNRHSSFDFGEFYVWVQCGSGQQGSTVAILPPFKQPRRNTTLLSATVSSLLPPDAASPLRPCLVFDVMLRSKNGQESMEVACKNGVLGLTSPDAVHGVMVGRPRSC